MAVPVGRTPGPQGRMRKQRCQKQRRRAVTDSILPIVSVSFPQRYFRDTPSTAQRTRDRAQQQVQRQRPAAEIFPGHRKQEPRQQYVKAAQAASTLSADGPAPP